MKDPSFSKPDSLKQNDKDNLIFRSGNEVDGTTLMADGQ